MSFANLSLNPSIYKAIGECGYDKPTPIQAAAIPPILDGKDVVACAQTGTGKTAAFVLPALELASKKSNNPNPRILILSPTRELASQITTAVDKYGKFLRLNIVSLVGGMPYHKQIRGLSRPLDIIVATPGRLLDHLQNGKVNLSNIEMFIIDEADRMLDMGFIDDVKHIAKQVSRDKQVLLFSATIDNRLSSIIAQLLKNPININVAKEKTAATQIKQTLYLADDSQHKKNIFDQLLINENIFKGIIFSATKIHADKLARQLRDQGYEAAALHGDLKQSVRNITVEKLRRGKIQFLVATDVAARGIDIADITHVINYDLPRSAEDYVHRIGRTGRAGKTGVAISLALVDDAKQIQRIERYIDRRFEFAVIPDLEPTKKLNFNNPTKKKPSRSKGFKAKNRGQSFSKNRKSNKRFNDKAAKKTNHNKH